MPCQSRVSRWLPCWHNCKRWERDKEARVTETGPKQQPTHHYTIPHYARRRACMPFHSLSVSFCCMQNTGGSGRQRSSGSGGGSKATPKTDRSMDGLHRKLPHGSQSLLWEPLRPGPFGSGTLARSSPKQRTKIPAGMSSAQKRPGWPFREPRKGQTIAFHHTTMLLISMRDMRHG